MEAASCFAQVTFSLRDSATCVFRSLAEEGNGVRKDKRLQWIEEGGKELHSRTWASWQSFIADVSFVTVSHRQEPLPPARTLRVPPPILSHLEG